MSREPATGSPPCLAHSRMLSRQRTTDDPNFIYGADRVESPGEGRDVLRMLSYERESGKVTVLLELP